MEAQKLKKQRKKRIYDRMIKSTLMYVSKTWRIKAVSYTHLDVYKRQVYAIHTIE